MATPTKPSPFQTQVLHIPEPYNLALLGGRGGGKSIGACFLTLRHVVEYGEEARPLLIRATLKSLLQLEEELAAMLTIAFGKINHNRADHIIKCPNGAIIELGQLDKPNSYGKYQGRSFTLLIVDEYTNFATLKYVNLLRSNLRGPEDLPIRYIIIGNPGGPQSVTVARNFVTGRTPWQPYTLSDETWVTCPSTYLDNPHISHEQYVRQIKAACGGDTALAAAWLENSWDVLSGAFFGAVFGDHLLLSGDEWKPPKGGIKNTGWYTGNGMDWGVAAPAVNLLYASPFRPGLPGPGGLVFPRKSILVLDEVHTARPEDPSLGLGWPPQVFCEEILEACARRNIHPVGVGDDAMGLNNESLLEQFREFGLYLDKPRKARLPGWSKIRQLMHSAQHPDPDMPGLWIHPRCRFLLETISVLPRDPLRMEDVDTSANDHASDALRYLVNTPPRISRVTRVKGLV